MSIKVWWDKLNNPPGMKYDYEFYKEETEKESEKVDKGEGSKYMLEHYTSRAVENLKLENQFLRTMMQYYFVNRKMASVTEVYDQLIYFSKACEALAHNKLLGVSRESEVSRIIEAAWENERAKLLYLMFDEMNVSAEVVEQKIAEYKKEIGND